MKMMRAILCLISIVAVMAGVGRDSIAAEGKGDPLIVFSSNRGGSWAIWTVKPDGSKPAQLSKPGTDEQDVDPAFNADGTRILFTSTRGGKAGLWQMGRDGSEAKRICDGDQGCWSPDGKKIVLRRGGKLIAREISSDKEKVISPDGWEKCSGPSWSPDGASIAFALLGDGSNAIYIVAAEGGEAKKVFDKQGACQPHWAPSGKFLVYETETHLCTINADGSKNRLITYFGGVQRFARFNPEGTKLVFCQAASPEGPWELYIIPATGGTPVKLTEGGSDMYPDWR